MGRGAGSLQRLDAIVTGAAERSEVGGIKGSLWMRGEREDVVNVLGRLGTMSVLAERVAAYGVGRNEVGANSFPHRTAAQHGCTLKRDVASTDRAVIRRGVFRAAGLAWLRKGATAGVVAGLGGRIRHGIAGDLPRSLLRVGPARRVGCR